MEKFVRHVGRVFTSCAAVVRDRGRVDFESLPPMRKGDGTVEAFEERAAELVEALEGLPEDFPVWNWFGIDPPIPGFYHRRMAQELAVHRWDGQSAAGTPSPIAAELRPTATAELLVLFLVLRRGRSAGRSTCTATRRQRSGPSRATSAGATLVSMEKASTAAVRGSSLLDLPWTPLPVSSLDVVGDADIAAAWSTAVKILAVGLCFAGEAGTTPPPGR